MLRLLKESCLSALKFLLFLALGSGVAGATTVTVDSVEACVNYTWHGQGYTQSGTYLDSINADSSAMLVLTIHQASSSFESIYSCGCHFWNGQNYTQSGNYSFHSFNGYGCDSIAYLELTVAAPSYSSQTASVCDSYDWNGQTYTQSGTYTFTTSNSAYCDSIVTLYLTITPSGSDTTFANACDSYTWSANGQTFSSSGTYVYTSGCTTAILSLVVSPSTQSVQTVTAVDSFVWSANGRAYTQSGSYASVIGCHTDSLYLTILGQATVHVTFFIEGFYEGPAMRSVLMNRGVGSDAFAVDTVLANLADPIDPSIIVATDYAILDVDGNATFEFPGSLIGNSYYLSVQNNNSIRTWTASPIQLNAVTSYDFSYAATRAFGDNMVEVAPGVWAIYTGDLNQDGSIDSFDYSSFQSDAISFSSGYFNTDMNGDGFVDSFDFAVFNQNTSLFISELHP